MNGNDEKMKWNFAAWGAILALLWISAGWGMPEWASASGDHATAAVQHQGQGPVPPKTRPAITFGDKFYDVTLQNQHLWVVGYFGTIVHSPDRGKTWERQNAGTNASLLSVSFVNENIGWIVGDQALILHTQDGGATWGPQKSPVPAEKLLKVQFLDENVGFAVGSFGVIIHTDDGGANWRQLPFEEDVTLNDLVFLSHHEGWVVGEFETILHTTDGGKIWEKQRNDQMGQLFGLDFRNPNEGVAVGTAGKTLITVDGGKTWTETPAATSDTLLKVRFSGNTDVLAVGLRGTVVASSDNGQNWSSIVIPNHYTWLSGLVFDDQGTGVLVGNQGTILADPNSQYTWVPIGMTPPLD